MATRTPKRLTRSSAKQRANTPKKSYLGDVAWAKGFLVATGIEGSKDLSLVQLIKAAAKDGIDLKAMRPDSLSEADKGNHSKNWERVYLPKLREGGPELIDLLTSCSNVLALHNHSELQTHAATLAAHGIDIKTLYGKVEALGGKVETIGGEVEDVVNRVGNLEELVKGGAQRSHSTKAPVDFVPPSTDKKPSADDRETKQPSPILSPRNLLTTFNGGSTGDDAGVLKTAPVASSAPPGISIADLPLDDESFFVEYYRTHPEKVDAVLSAAFAAAEPFMESDEEESDSELEVEKQAQLVINNLHNEGLLKLAKSHKGLTKKVSEVQGGQQLQQKQINDLQRQREDEAKSKSAGGFLGGIFS